jgi:hypothetical protein
MERILKVKETCGCAIVIYRAGQIQGLGKERRLGMLLSQKQLSTTATDAYSPLQNITYFATTSLQGPG